MNAWKPVEYKLADAVAVQALIDGTATPEQQQRFMRWLVENGCATYDQSFRPGGEDGRRESDFAEGRRFVGLTVIKMSRRDFNDALRRKDNAGK